MRTDGVVHLFGKLIGVDCGISAGRPPRHPLSRLTPLRGRGIRGYSFLKWVLIIQVGVVFESVVLCLPVLIMEISVESDHTTLSESLLNTGIFPSPGGVSVCFAHGRGGSSVTHRAVLSAPYSLDSFTP